MTHLKKAIFLDRDGTLNVDFGYIHTRSRWQWIEGAIDGLRMLKSAGFSLIVVSNQSGIARKMFSENELKELETSISQELETYHAKPDAWYYCPHLPEITGPCLCRKPSPGMIVQAAAEHSITLSQSWMIGDSLRDVLAGLAAGVSPIKLGNGQSEEDKKAKELSAHVFPNLYCAAKWILSK